MDKKNKRTKLSYKTFMYMLASIGYVLVVLGTILCYFFGSYLGKSRAYITDKFYDNAIEKYSIAAVTQDKDFDYVSKDYRYILIRGDSPESVKKEILNGGMPDQSVVKADNMTDSDIETVRKYLEGDTIGGRVKISQYTYGSGSYYRLTVDKDRFDWPYSPGLSLISHKAGDGRYYLNKIGIYPDKRGVYIYAYNESDAKWFSASDKACDAQFTFRSVINTKLRSFSYSCSDYSYVEAKKKAMDAFAEYGKEKDYEWLIDLSQATDDYGNPYVGEPYTSVSGDKVRMLNDKTVISGKIMSMNDTGEFSVAEDENSSDQYVVVSYIPEKLSDPSDLFSRIASGVTGVMTLSIFGVILLIAGFIAFGAGVVMFIFAAGHTAVVAFPEKKDHYRKVTDGDYIERTAFANIPLDIGTIIYLIIAAAILKFSTSIGLGTDFAGYMMLIVVIYLLFIVSAIYVYSVTVNVKLGGAWRNTCIYRIYHRIRKQAEKVKQTEYLRNSVRDLNRRAQTLFLINLGCNLIIGLMAVYGAFRCGYYFGDGQPLVIIAIVLFIINEIYRHTRLRRSVDGLGVIKDSARKIADGDLGHQAGTAELPVDEKQIVDDLNSISNSIDKAVDERLKSEHMQTELITNVSHDIRTPLTSIINYTDLLSRPDITDEQKKEYLDILTKQSNKLKKLINDLIDASKAESGKIDMHPEDINAGTMLSMMAGEYEEKLSKKNVTLEVTGLEDDTTIKADPNYLGRVFQNLFGNMVKYAQPGTRAYVDIESSENKVTVIFRNISSERLHITADELTERFVRGDISRTTEGSGLGLSIAKNLTELMGGEFHLTIDGDLFKVELKF